MKRIASITLSVVFLAAGYVIGKDAPNANPYAKVLSVTPAAELPAKAADLVRQAKSANREATTITVVKSAVGMNPAAAPAIVGAVARAVPPMAPVAAGAAAAEQPKQARAIAKAAAAAAPSQAGEIVVAVCRAVPKDFQGIAVAVSQMVPGAGKEIVEAVQTVRPDLKPSLERAVAGYGGKVVSVGDTLSQAALIAQSQSGSVGVIQPETTTLARSPLLGRGPGVGPPYMPLTVAPTNVTSGTSGEVPEGGRNYAKP
ncbi:MAG TPA: hypothetical protein P5205_11615 [Candidatus Paceibacterota bacterium]|nr:hypothetical protein [Verrucomicrobiota bacterium]HSA11006.1 hypothetical protein [Candidatus Paceibacterota bacterium]